VRKRGGENSIEQKPQFCRHEETVASEEPDIGDIPKEDSRVGETGDARAWRVKWLEGGRNSSKKKAASGVTL